MLILTALVATATALQNPKYLSNESALALKELNNLYNMVITEDLLNDKDSSRLLTSLLRADVMQSPVTAEKSPYQGLIVSFNEQDDGMLLVQPKQKVSEEALGKIALRYQSAIPEASFELDQNLAISGEEAETSENPLILEIKDPDEEESTVSVTVAVIDSGLQIDHPHFENTVISINPAANLLTGKDDVVDDVGHGTHVAGIIAKNAPEATLYPYKIVDKNGGRLSSVIKAVNLAIEDEVEVINMSFGVMDSSYALENMVEKAEEEGIIVVAAAGNFGDSTGFYPAAYKETLAVGGVYENGRKMRTSNYGDWVDVAAEGYRINSSIPQDSYDYKDGTSQSAAFVSAVIANLIMEYPTKTPEELFEILNTNSKVRSGEFYGLPLIK